MVCTLKATLLIWHGGCSPEIPFKAVTRGIRAPYSVGARYLYPQHILIDSRRLQETDTRSAIQTQITSTYPA